MGNYRDRLRIIADILQITSQVAKKTQIMYQANLSYKLLCRYLDEVVDAGLVSLEDEDFYLLTEKGKEFLFQHEEYSRNCKTHAEQFTHINTAKTGLEKMCLNKKGTLGTRGKMPNKRTLSGSSRTPMKGVVLAAGEGTRIRQVTYGGFPKELLPIGNVPTIRFPIEALRLAGLRDILIVIAPQTKHGIIDGLQSGERLGVNISYVVQEKEEKGRTGLGQAILSARGRIRNNENFVVACGDSILCDFSQKNPLLCLNQLIKVHQRTDAIATIMVYPTTADPTRFGVCKFKSFSDEDGVLYGELERLIEKPNLETAKSFSLNGFHYIAVGYYVFKPEIFSYIQETKPGTKNEVQITDAMNLALARGEHVYAVVHAKNRGKEIIPCVYWDVGIPEDYAEANKHLFDVNLEKLLSLVGRK